MNGKLPVAIIWHMHQPYYRHPQTSEFVLPWVRLHASKDYLHMARLLQEFPGVLPWVAGVGSDPVRTVADGGPGNESWTWSTPSSRFPEGSYLVRIEAYRGDEAQHYAHHQEKFFVKR